MPRAQSWFERNTFHHSAFSDLGRLVELKRELGLKVSVCFPTLNEAATIAKEIVVVKAELATRFPLVDEIGVIDSGSSDRTREIAAECGASVWLAEDILPGLPPLKGKGENLWKALHVLSGDVVVYVDADIKNIHPRFVYGLLGPILAREGVKYSKAFYDRPIAVDQRNLKPSGGGRVTELVIRPLFSLHYPELAEIIQPLSGEYAGTRDVLEAIPFPIGYGIETSMLIDILERWGMDVIAQVDLDRRVHRNQDTLALGRMAFGIMKTFFRKLESSGKASYPAPSADEMIQFQLDGASYRRDARRIELVERPPIVGIPEYLAARQAEREGGR